MKAVRAVEKRYGTLSAPANVKDYILFHQPKV
jgi:hypothetical protein